MADPNLFPDKDYPDGTVWGPGDECEEREILRRLDPDHEESFRAVAGFGERRVVVYKVENGYCVDVQRWDETTKGHSVEDFVFATEVEALEKAHKLMDLEFERWRYGYPEVQ